MTEVCCIFLGASLLVIFLLWGKSLWLPSSQTEGSLHSLSTCVSWLSVMLARWWARDYMVGEGIYSGRGLMRMLRYPTLSPSLTLFLITFILCPYNTYKARGWMQVMMLA